MQLEQPIAGYNGNPQKEDGYTPIANELLEAILLYNFTARQITIILALCRMTYGYSKKSDALSGWQIAKMTNIDRSHVSKTLEELINLNVIIRHPLGRYSHGVLVNEIAINKRYDEWITVAKTARVPKQPPLPKRITTVAELATQPLPKQPTHKASKTTKTNNVDEYQLPDWINKQHWDVWHTHPKRKKATKEQKDLVVKKLEKWKDAGLDYAKALEDAATNMWQGIFDPPPIKNINNENKPDWLKV